MARVREDEGSVARTVGSVPHNDCLLLFCTKLRQTTEEQRPPFKEWCVHLALTGIGTCISARVLMLWTMNCTNEGSELAVEVHVWMFHADAGACRWRCDSLLDFLA